MYLQDTLKTISKSEIGVTLAGQPLLALARAFNTKKKNKKMRKVMEEGVGPTGS
jgi:hypothetical protein